MRAPSTMIAATLLLASLAFFGTGEADGCAQNCAPCPLTTDDLPCLPLCFICLSAPLASGAPSLRGAGDLVAHRSLAMPHDAAMGDSTPCNRRRLVSSIAQHMMHGGCVGG